MTTTEGVGERLRLERERLRISQEKLADIGGVSRQSQGLYEAGKRVPDANYLTAVAAAGVDAGWIITGRRSAVIAAEQHGERYAAGELDLDRLQAAIEALEEGLRGSGRDLLPQQKAEVIRLIYDLLDEEDNSARVLQLVRRVA